MSGISPLALGVPLEQLLVSIQSSELAQRSLFQNAAGIGAVERPGGLMLPLVAGAAHRTWFECLVQIVELQLQQLW